MTSSRDEGAVIRYWPLLLPGAYLLHLAEEVWGGRGFVDWASRYLSADFTTSRFVLINAVAWPAMLLATLAAIHRPALRWLLVSVAVVLLVNGTLHLGSTLATGAYSPGVVSGALVYLPLGAATLRRESPRLEPAALLLAAGLGVAAHALVVYVAFGIGRP